MPRNTLGAVRCKAHSSRSGEPCKQWAIHGSTVCVTHGGSASQVKFSARERIEALVPLALDKIERLIKLADQDSVSLNAAKDILDRAGHKPRDRVEIAPIEVKHTVDDSSARLLADLLAAGLNARSGSPGEGG